MYHRKRARAANQSPDVFIRSDLRLRLPLRPVTVHQKRLLVALFAFSESQNYLQHRPAGRRFERETLPARRKGANAHLLNHLPQFSLYGVWFAQPYGSIKELGINEILKVYLERFIPVASQLFFLGGFFSMFSSRESLGSI